MRDAANRNLEKQTYIFGRPHKFHALLTEMPFGEPPAPGGDSLKTIKSLINKHKGELREWSGEWKAVDAPLPYKKDQPGMFHDQFYPAHTEDQDAISTVLTQPASGGNTGHSVRVAITFGLADLFYDYGDKFNAGELYQLYKKLRVFAHPKEKTKCASKKRTQARTQHWKRWDASARHSGNAGRWR